MNFSLTGESPEIRQCRFQNASIKVGIAIPTYNEKVNLHLLIDRLFKVFQEAKINGRIVIVDDNSTDGTGELADSLAYQYPNISVIHRPGKLGLGSAYKDAFQFLLQDPQIAVVMEMDGDLSHEPEYIPSFITKIQEGYDVVIGSRYIYEGGVDKAWSPMRRLISKSANFLTTLLTGLTVNDCTSGFRAYDSYALRIINLSKIRSNNYAFQIDMLFHCSKSGCEIAETPIIFKARVHGSSKLGAGAILEFIKTLENSFAERLYALVGSSFQSWSIWIANSFWIGLKPLRKAIRQANKCQLQHICEVRKD